MRPISPLAWLPLGLVLFQKSEPAALFAIAVCSMWPTVINTMMGVRAIPQDYWNVAKVLRLSRTTTFLKIIVPATLPYMFTGYRLSLGIAWLVIVASEMLTGTPGVGGFLWQEYNSLIYAHILLAIITIGVIGFVLDRLMGLAEAKLRAVVRRRWPSSRSTASPSRSPSRSGGARHVLRDVSLGVEHGEFVSIVGAMGSGKSTLLSLLAGLTTPDAGSVAVGGEPVRGVRRDAAFVFQNYSLLPWFTALENVRLAVDGGVSGRSSRDAAAARARRRARAGRPRQRAQPAARPAVGRHAAARGDRARVRDRARRSCFSTSRSARSTR